MTDDAPTSRANIALHLDNGAEMQFSGRPFAGGSWFDEETGELTRQKLYATESGEHIYSIVTAKARQRSRRACTAFPCMAKPVPSTTGAPR